MQDLVYPQRSVGLLRFEYEGDGEEEVSECDKKLTVQHDRLLRSKGKKRLSFPAA